ncbi:hypothetical protein M514_07515 [Trichuris suis]|uniref:Uncharacterized protein n=1 Tax=Trichuris suis TaxID=68888 RepID=A0A085M340_9BILA|nr:hypothetical protein M513_07515 [Trichuris suis]KFD67775.1 hypothetical protein M514_07515 [Trichuris suis]
MRIGVVKCGSATIMKYIPHPVMGEMTSLAVLAFEYNRIRPGKQYANKPSERLKSLRLKCI